MERTLGWESADLTLRRHPSRTVVSLGMFASLSLGFLGSKTGGRDGLDGLFDSDL